MTETINAVDILRPSGYRLLVRVPPLEEMTKGGIVRPASTRAVEESATQLGEVLAMGPAAYGDAEKFPDGPWCQVGDVIFMRQYSGTRFKIGGQEYRLINDDTVEGVALRPELIERAV